MEGTVLDTEKRGSHDYVSVTNRQAFLFSWGKKTQEDRLASDDSFVD
jgi:hypothetical protein